jgi:hypothetical protein
VVGEVRRGDVGVDDADGDASAGQPAGTQTRDTPEQIDGALVYHLVVPRFH